MPVFLRWLLRLGPINPITVRLVQNGSRRTRHLYIRSAYLAVLIIVLLWTLLIGTSSSDLSYGALASAGAKSFTWIAFLQVTLICVLAPVFMAGAIAQEASPRTWEVLLSTPLSALQIVLGNLLGRLFFILALLFASLPLFALTQYFGGVPGRSIVACYLVAACAALLVGSIAIALSVSRMVGKRAVFAFYVAVVSYLAITFGVDRMLTGKIPGAMVTYMTAINPFLALHSLLNPTTYNAAAPGTRPGLLGYMLERPVATWCWMSTILSMLLVGISTFTVRAGGLSTFSGDDGVPWYRKMFGLAAAGSEHRAPRAVWTNPVAWREAAARNATLGRIIARWTFISLGGLFGLGLVVWYHTTKSPRAHDEFRMVLLLTVLGELAVTALVAINMAATAISREREDGTLDLLLTTPITPGQYLTGKLRGLIAYLLPMLAVPLGTIAIAGIYTLFGGLERAGGVLVPGPTAAPGVQTPVVLPEAAIVAPLVVIPFIAFCAMVGLQWSLKSKGTIGSVVATVGVVGLISSLVGICGWSLGRSVPVVGPIVAAISPGTAIFGLVDPLAALSDTVMKSSLGTARLCLFIGSVVAAGIYSGIVYGIHSNMVRTFDMTVRRLAGNR